MSKLLAALQPLDEGSRLTFSVRYDLMTTDQAPPAVIAEWLQEPLFAAYIAKRRKY
jgi:hypothetical protein